MASDDVIYALIDRWDEVQKLLSPAARVRLAGYLDDLAETRDDADLAEILGLIAGLLYDELPADDPIRAAWTRSTTRGVGLKDWPGITARLMDRAQPVRLEAQEWLLAAPAMPPGKVPGPDRPHLIRLVRPDGSVHVPAFQFDAAGLAHRIVIEVNQVLDADDDPWGAADWWLGPNAWLDAAPAARIGQVSDDALLSVARDLSADS